MRLLPNFHPKPEVGRGEKRLVCPSSEKTSWLSWPEFDVCLQFENVQMVMNRHCWGEAHGAPLNSLSLHTPWKFVNNQQGTLFLAKFDMEPKIVDGRLILRTTQRAFFTKDQARITTVNSLFKVCKHKMTRCLELNLASLMEESDSDLEKDQTYRSKLFVCSRCSVFHDTSILENGLFEEATRADAGMEFVLRTWMDLGQCEAASTRSRHCGFPQRNTAIHILRPHARKQKRSLGKGSTRSLATSKPRNRRRAIVPSPYRL